MAVADAIHRAAHPLRSSSYHMTAASLRQLCPTPTTLPPPSPSPTTPSNSSSSRLPFATLPLVPVLGHTDRDIHRPRGTNTHREEWVNKAAELLAKGACADPAAFFELAAAHSSPKLLEGLRKVHDFLLRSRFRDDLQVNNKVLEMHAVCGNMTHPRRTLEHMFALSMGFCNVMTNGHLMNGLEDDLLQRFDFLFHPHACSSSFIFVHYCLLRWLATSRQRGFKSGEPTDDDGFDSFRYTALLSRFGLSIEDTDDRLFAGNVEDISWVDLNATQALEVDWGHFAGVRYRLEPCLLYENEEVSEKKLLFPYSQSIQSFRSGIRIGSILAVWGSVIIILDNGSTFMYNLQTQEAGLVVGASFLNEVLAASLDHDRIVLAGIKDTCLVIAERTLKERQGSADSFQYKEGVISFLAVHGTIYWISGSYALVRATRDGGTGWNLGVHDLSDDFTVPPQSMCLLWFEGDLLVIEVNEQDNHNREVVMWKVKWDADDTASYSRCYNLLGSNAFVTPGFSGFILPANEGAIGNNVYVGSAFTTDCYMYNLTRGTCVDVMPCSNDSRHPSCCSRWVALRGDIINADGLDDREAVEQSVNDGGGATMDDNDVEGHEVVDQSDINGTSSATEDIAVEDEEKVVEQCEVDEWGAIKGQYAVEQKDYVNEQTFIEEWGTTSDCTVLEDQNNESELCICDEQIAIKDVVAVHTPGNMLGQFTEEQRATRSEFTVEKHRDIVEHVRHEWSVTEDDLSIDSAASKGITDVSSSEVVSVMLKGSDGGIVKEEEVLLFSGNPQNPRKLNCPFYMSKGSCSCGFSCHFNHPLGPENCIYMRNGTCRYGGKCHFNHPEKVIGAHHSKYTYPTSRCYWKDTSVGEFRYHVPQQ